MTTQEISIITAQAMAAHAHRMAAYFLNLANTPAARARWSAMKSAAAWQEDARFWSAKACATD